MANRALAAKLDRAKRQVRDLVTIESLKPIYIGQGKAKPFSPEELQGVTVKTYECGLNSSGKYVRPNEFRARSGCDPRTRGELVPGSVDRPRAVVWSLPAEVIGSRLIKRA